MLFKGHGADQGLENSIERKAISFSNKAAVKRAPHLKRNVAIFQLASCLLNRVMGSTLNAHPTAAECS